MKQTDFNKNTPEDHYVIIGKLGTTYGIKGWLRIQSFTEPTLNIFEYSIWYIRQGNEWVSIVFDKTDVNNDKLLVHIKGYDTPEEAKQLTGFEVAIKHAQLPSLAKGEYYWHDLVGLSVYTTDNIFLGTVQQVINNAAHPLLEIKGEQYHLVPLIFKKFVIDIDLAHQKIVVDWDPEF